MPFHVIRAYIERGFSEASSTLDLLYAICRADRSHTDNALIRGVRIEPNGEAVSLDAVCRQLIRFLPCIFHFVSLHLSKLIGSICIHVFISGKSDSLDQVHLQVLRVFTNVLANKDALSLTTKKMQLIEEQQRWFNEDIKALVGKGPKAAHRFANASDDNDDDKWYFCLLSLLSRPVFLSAPCALCCLLFVA
jgi:hypothetical protein